MTKNSLEHGHDCLVKATSHEQARVLWMVLAINFGMFFVEGFYGLVARSVSLLADSLDMLGDALVCGISLYVIGKSARLNAAVSLVKSLVMAAFGVGVLANALHRYLASVVPIAETMGAVAMLALLANIICAVLLVKHSKENLNMRSAWLCSRNDVLASLGVLVAAVAVARTNSNYPDLIVGIAIACMVLKSAIHVFNESVAELRHH